MKIAVIGSGNIGGTLGRRWATQGHQIMFGSRDPLGDKINNLLQIAGNDTRAGTIREAVAFGEAIVLAVPPSGVAESLEMAGNLNGKILINCTNRYDEASADEEVRRLVPDARIVRAFHTLPWEVLASPYFNDGKPAVFLYGDDSAAVKIVARLTSDIGLDPIDVGSSGAMAKAEAANGILWSVLGPKFGREYSLGVLRR